MSTSIALTVDWDKPTRSAKLALIEVCETTHAPDIPSCGAVCGTKLPTWPGRTLDSIISLAVPVLVHRTPFRLRSP